MATSAFRSTTKRAPLGAPASAASGDSTSSGRGSVHRRSRSLSRFSHQLSERETPFADDAPVSKGRFVNTVRGSGFPEISLDDLAVEFFGSADRGRSATRNADVSPRNAGSASQRQGRSVSRQSSGTGGGSVDRRNSICNASAVGKSAAEAHSCRRRSLSVVRCPISDSESDLDRSHSSPNSADVKNSNYGSSQMLSSRKEASAPQRKGLRRSLSQKDFKTYDGYFSQSSTLTDDEVRDTHSPKDGIERTIRAVYAQTKGEHPTRDDRNGEIYEVMRRELRHAVEEMKMEIGQAMSKCVSGRRSDDAFSSKDTNGIQAFSNTSSNCSNRLDQPERHKTDLLSQIAMEEKKIREHPETVTELLPEPNGSITAKPARSRRRSNDRSRMSKRLSEEAEKYIEDFIANIEDTDISSIDGERSDTSSTLGGIVKADNFQTTVLKPLSLEMDGVMLPWLQWETSNDVSLQSSCNKKAESPTTPVSSNWSAQGANNRQDQSGYSRSSQGSWNPETLCPPSMVLREEKLCSQRSPLGSSADVDEYLRAINNEDLLYETWSQRQMISSGGLLLCNNNKFF
ncbi:hypothetical protein SAY86_021650 [Trapa natans]|uniref:Uncharacterized protein n=1 Tax=Trapa natans TaxID=22666 RepID=A0AAN7M2F2_TRANT|nr:hypothetical protein SAY86_021650 [Trapa natans]